MQQTTSPSESKQQRFEPQTVRYRAAAMRMDIVRMIGAAGSGHPGGSLSCADILATLFFSGVMHYDPNNVNAPWRDRFLLSKGHAAPALYAAFAQIGWIGRDELATLRTLGSRLQGHPDSKLLPGVEVCSGSLGQGLSVGVGIALGLRLQKQTSDRLPNVYVLCGDGELQEGSNWEALMYAAHQQLNNIVLFVDCNSLQIDGRTSEVCTLGDLTAKLNAFGWNAQGVDGHDHSAIYDAIQNAHQHTSGPSAIICNTIKGKGVSFMEDAREWHGKAPGKDQLDLALNELESTLAISKSEGIQ